MSETLTIEVTQEDIEKGALGDMRACPIARAARRQFGPLTDVRVLETHMTVNGVPYRASTRASRFVVQFDNDRRPVKPSRFRFRKMGV